VITAAPTGRSERLESGIARRPDESGFATSADGIRLAYDIFGTGERTLVLLPSAPIIHSRQWKAQIHFLSRYHRVVTFDGRGNGRSDRPTDSAAYVDERMVEDIEAVMAATATPRAVLVGLCGDGVWRAIRLAAEQPNRVDGIVAFSVGVPRLSPPQQHYADLAFDDELPTDEGWAKYNRHYWRRDYPGFARFFFEQMATEPHSTKLIDDAAGWAVDGSVDAMIAENGAGFTLDVEAVEAICRRVTCPMIIVHGTDDRCQPVARAHRLAELTGAPLVIVEGANHMIPGRHPVLANLLIRDFVRSLDGRKDR
jgi:pimeloyl-ACP methyl ester carboxylesterase